MIEKLHAEITAVLLALRPDDTGALSWRARELQADVHRLEEAHPELEQARIDAMVERTTQ